jgi:hypothetical protein
MKRMAIRYQIQAEPRRQDRNAEALDKRGELGSRTSEPNAVSHQQNRPFRSAKQFDNAPHFPLDVSASIRRLETLCGRVEPSL